jgi:hypothetical protein
MSGTLQKRSWGAMADQLTVFKGPNATSSTGINRFESSSGHKAIQPGDWRAVAPGPGCVKGYSPTAIMSHRIRLAPSPGLLISFWQQLAVTDCIPDTPPGTAPGPARKRQSSFYFHCRRWPASRESPSAPGGQLPRGIAACGQHCQHHVPVPACFDNPDKVGAYTEVHGDRAARIGIARQEGW